jgi:hypothetical protein
MAAVDIDRQAIERRDFPIARRGYDPAAVDAHLRVLANEIEELQRELGDGGRESSLAATAGTQVHSILAAAEAAAADIERQALDEASTLRADADRDAAETRERAIEQARAHVAAVSDASAVLLERVSSMDGEVGTLVEALRSGAGRLTDDLSAVEKNMDELYDAASGRGASPPKAPPTGSRGSEAAAPGPTDPPASSPPAPAPSHTPVPSPAAGPSIPAPGARASRPPRAAASGPVRPAAASVAENGDLDGARLTALNMALNGESRAEADRVLAENFQVPDRMALIDEVYASIET